MKGLLDRLNPFRVDRLEVAPAPAIAARVIVFVLLLIGDRPFARRLPYFAFLDAVGDAATFDAVVRTTAVAGFALVLAGPFLRTGAALVGLAYLTGLLASRGQQSVAHTFVAAALLAVALSDRRSGGRLLRLQVLFVYGAASLHKALDPDWWNGAYFDTFLGTRHQHAGYLALASALPPQMLGSIGGIATILTQAAIFVLLAVRRTRGLGVLLGIVFHGSMVLVTDQTFGPFLVATLVSYLAFLPWPDDAVARVRGGLVRRALRLCGFVGRVEEGTRVAPEFEAEGVGRTGLAAAALIALRTPLVHAAAAYLATRTGRLVPVRDVALAAAVVLSAAAIARVAARGRFGGRAANAAG